MIKKPSNISVKRLTLPPTNVKRIIHVVGKPWEDGHTPTTEELLALITPLIPEPKTPDEEAIKADILKKLTKKVEKICEKMKEGKETKEEPEEDENEEKKELEISEDRWDLIIKYDGKTYKIPAICEMLVVVAVLHLGSQSLTNPKPSPHHPTPTP